MLESQATYAARRRVSQMAVSHWKRRGWLVLKNGKVDVEASDASLARYRSEPRPDLGRKAEPKAERKAEPKAEQPGEQPESAAGKLARLPKAELDRLLQIQRVAMADLERREAAFGLDLREGRLLKTDDVVRTNSLRCLGLRNRLLAIPSEQAIRLANCNDPAQAAGILRDAITEALNEFLREYGIAQN